MFDLLLLHVLHLETKPSKCKNNQDALAFWRKNEIVTNCNVGGGVRTLIKTAADIHIDKSV